MFLKFFIFERVLIHCWAALDLGAGVQMFFSSRQEALSRLGPVPNYQ